MNNPNHQVFETLIQPEIDNFCSTNNSNSDDVDSCKNRLTDYIHKGHQLPSCTANKDTMYAVAPVINAFPDTSRDKGDYSLVVVRDAMSKLLPTANQSN